MDLSPDIRALWLAVNRSAGDAEILEQLRKIWKRFDTDVASAMTSDDAAERLARDSDELSAILADLRSRGRGHIVDQFDRLMESGKSAQHMPLEERIYPPREEEFHDMVRGPCSCGAWH